MPAAREVGTAQTQGPGFRARYRAWPLPRLLPDPFMPPRSSSVANARPARGAGIARRAGRLSRRACIPPRPTTSSTSSRSWRSTCGSSSPRGAASGRAVGCGAVRTIAPASPRRAARLWRSQAHERRPRAARRGIGARLLARAGGSAARQRHRRWRCSRPGATRPKRCACTSAAGYARRAAFGGYPDNGLSLFTGKALDEPRQRRLRPSSACRALRARPRRDSTPAGARCRPRCTPTASRRRRRRAARRDAVGGARERGLPAPEGSAQARRLPVRTARRADRRREQHRDAGAPS